MCSVPVAGLLLASDWMGCGCWRQRECAGASWSPRDHENIATIGTGRLWPKVALLCGCSLCGVWSPVWLRGTCASFGVSRWWSGASVGAGEGARIRSRLRGGCPGWVTCGYVAVATRSRLGAGCGSCGAVVACVARFGCVCAGVARECGGSWRSSVIRRSRFSGRYVPGGESPRRTSACMVVGVASIRSRVGCGVVPVVGSWCDACPGGDGWRGGVFCWFGARMVCGF